LRAYFAKEENDSERYKRIRRVLEDKTALSKLYFVSQAAADFLKFERMFQAEEPLIHRLYDALKDMFQSVTANFLTKEELDKKTTPTSTDLTKVVDLNKVVVGHETEQELRKLDDGKKKLMLLKFREFYRKCAKYIQSHFPENNLLRSLRCLDPLYIKKNSSSLTDIKNVVESFAPHLTSAERNSVESEWVVYRVEKIPDEWISHKIDSKEKEGESEVKFHRIDIYWSKIFALKDSEGKAKYPSLTKLVKLALVLPHGNSDVERSLSINKNVVRANRTALHVDTIRGIRYAKDAISFYDPLSRRPELVPITKQLIREVKSARAKYMVFLEEEKERTKKKNEEFEGKQELKRRYEEVRKIVEAQESKLVSIKSAEADNLKEMAVAKSLVDDAQSRLAYGLERDDNIAIKTAHELLKAGNANLQSAMEQAKVVRQKLSDVESRKRKAVESLEQIIKDMEK
jgi:hypothetical protein